MSDTAPYSTNIVLLHRYGEKELFISQSITVMVHKICDLTKLKKLAIIMMAPRILVHESGYRMIDMRSAGTADFVSLHQAAETWQRDSQHQPQT